MLSIFCLIFLAIFQKFSLADDDVSGYVLDSETPLELSAANLKLLSFRLLNNWVDFTLEYTQTSGTTGADAQFFAIGFGNTRMKCTYAITFEPKLDSDNETISSVTITERQLGDHEPGRELARRLAYIETSISQNPLAVIRARLIRQRVIPSNQVINSSEECSSNPTGYYQFPFNDEDINIIFSKGVNGAITVQYHTPPNRNISAIPLRAATPEETNNVSIPTNVTNMPTCPKPFALNNYTFAERFDSPIIGRVCGSCSNNNFNSTNEPVTIIPISTSISGISSLVNNSDEEENNFQCLTMNENDSYPNPQVCGCANELSPNVSILFLVDGGGKQNDSDWEQFTWKILEGFFMDIMLGMNASAITTNSTDLNATMNNTMLENLDVNVVIYGGNYPLQVQKLDWNFLQNISTDPIPKGDRFFSNLCNATLFAAQYLMNSNQSSKILITIPWQDASDELDCLICNNCSLNGINSFTAKVFDQVDLSLVESTFGGYGNCTYLYENATDAEGHKLQEWPYVLAGISDFICLMSPSVMIPEVNFSLELLMASRIPPNQLNAYLKNISFLIEEAFENASNYSVEAKEDFNVDCLSVNQSDIVLPLPASEVPMFTVMLENVVHCANNKIKDILVPLAKGHLFSQLLNNSFYNFFKNINGNAIVYVYSVDNVIIFNLSEFSTTQIESSTMLPSSTSIFNMNTTMFIEPTKATAGNIIDRARRFVMRLVPWMIALIVIGAVLVCLLLVGLCALLFRRSRRDYEKENVKDKEQMPMIVTNTVASQYLETTKSQQIKQQQAIARVPDDEDEQIYV